MTERWVRLGTRAWTREFMSDRVITAVLQMGGDLDDLTAVVTCAAMAEYLLRELIATKADMMVLEPRNQPLSFMAMVRLAQSLRVLPSSLRNTLSRLARVRNTFAHDIAHRMSSADAEMLRESLSDAQRGEVNTYEQEVIENRGLAKGPALFVRCFAICVLNELKELVERHDETPFD
jgi:hypothetical protein